MSAKELLNICIDKILEYYSNVHIRDLNTPVRQLQTRMGLLNKKVNKDVKLRQIVSVVQSHCVNVYNINIKQSDRQSRSLLFCLKHWFVESRLWGRLQFPLGRATYFCFIYYHTLQLVKINKVIYWAVNSHPQYQNHTDPVPAYFTSVLN